MVDGNVTASYLFENSEKTSEVLLIIFTVQINARNNAYRANGPLSLATMIFKVSVRVFKLLKIALLPKIRQKCPQLSHFGFPCNRLNILNYYLRCFLPYNIMNWGFYAKSNHIWISDGSQVAWVTCCFTPFKISTFLVSDCHVETWIGPTVYSLYCLFSPPSFWRQLKRSYLEDYGSESEQYQRPDHL